MIRKGILVLWAVGLVAGLSLPGCSGTDEDGLSWADPVQAGGLAHPGEPIDYDPGEPGPYAVGNTTRIFMDTSRHDILTQGPRQLMTEIWYPVMPQDAIGEPDTPRAMLGPWADLVATVLGLVLPDEEVENFDRPLGSIRNAPLAPEGPYPVVIYSHGNAGIRFQAYTLCEHLASHGFIVAAPDHTGSAFVTALPDKLVIYNPLLSIFDFYVRPVDLMFLLDALVDLNVMDPQGMFSNTMDVGRVAISGHSYGGFAALETFRHDPRFSACIPFAGPDIPIVDEQIEQGLMSFVGMEDHTLGDYIPLHTLIYEMMPAPKALLRVDRAGHYSFTNVCDLVPSIMGDGDGCGTAQSLWDDSEITFIDADIAWRIVNTYVTAWLAWRLKDEDFTDLLQVNRFGQWMEYAVRLGQ